MGLSRTVSAINGDFSRRSQNFPTPCILRPADGVFLKLGIRHGVKQEAHLMLTNPRDAFSGQSRSPNIVPFHVRYSFLLCNRNFFFKMRRFSDIRLQKCRDLEIRVRGHSRLLKVVPFYRLGVVSY